MHWIPKLPKARPPFDKKKIFAILHLSLFKTVLLHTWPWCTFEHYSTATADFCVWYNPQHCLYSAMRMFMYLLVVAMYTWSQLYGIRYTSTVNKGSLQILLKKTIHIGWFDSNSVCNTLFDRVINSFTSVEKH